MRTGWTSDIDQYSKTCYQTVTQTCDHISPDAKITYWTFNIGTFSIIRSVRSQQMCSYLTHWGRVTHICVSKLIIIGSDNGLSPDRRQAIIWTNTGILLMGPLETNFSGILFAIYKFSVKKMCLKMSGKWRPSCLGLNVLKQQSLQNWLSEYCRCWWYPLGGQQVHIRSLLRPMAVPNVSYWKTILSQDRFTYNLFILPKSPKDSCHDNANSPDPPLNY